MLIAFLCTLLAAAGPYEDGVQALKAKDAVAARAHLERAVAEQPNRSEAWWELGWARWVQDDFAGARDAWLEVQRIDPQRDELDHWLATAEAKLALRGPALTATAVAEVPDQPALTIVAAGDTMMGSDLRKGKAGLAPDSGEVIFEDVRSVFHAADVAFLNLEGPLADGLPEQKCGPKSTACYAFRTPTRYTAALTSAGIDVASLANNHAMDLGAAGMQSTMKALDEVGIAHAGRYGDVAFVQAKGKTVAFVAAHSGTCCLNVNRLDEVTQAIRAADAKADFVVLSFHGGAEGARHRHVPGKTEIAWGERRGDVKALAHAAIDAGADLVLGHGPHVLRAVERYRGRLVVYSMGNFVGYRQFGTRGGYGGTSVMVEVELAENGALVGARLHPVALDATGIPHPDPNRLGHRHILELSNADFPGSGLQIADDGVVSWNEVAP